MSIIWATRGRDWGFKFLEDGGIPDPLPAYLQAFDGQETKREFCNVGTSGTALRFEDPLGRQDRSGRTIIHDFLLTDEMAQGVRSVEDGVQVIWPLVEEKYAKVWDHPEDSPE